MLCVCSPKLLMMNISQWACETCSSSCNKSYSVLMNQWCWSLKCGRDLQGCTTVSYRGSVLVPYLTWSFEKFCSMMKVLTGMLSRAHSPHLWKPEYSAQSLEKYHLTMIKFVSFGFQFVCFHKLLYPSAPTQHMISSKFDWNCLGSCPLYLSVSYLKK